MAKARNDVRYVSCLFWVLSAEGSASDKPSMHSLLRRTNTPVFDFFLQTSQLFKSAEKLSIAQDMLSGDETRGLFKVFTSVEVHFITRVMLFSKIKTVMEELVPAHRREALHRATWLLFLNVQHEHKTFDMFPGFCLCVASLHAVLASDHPEGFDPFILGETSDSVPSEKKASYDAWSQALLSKACAEQSVVAEVQRAAAQVQKEWRDSFGPGSDFAGMSQGEDRTSGTRTTDGFMTEVEIEMRCGKLSERLNNRLSQVPLAQLDGRILLDSPHLVERKKVASPDKGDGAAVSAAAGGTSSHPGSPSKLLSVHGGLPCSPSVAHPPPDDSIFRTPDRPTRTARTAPPATPFSSMQKDHSWLSSLVEGTGVSCPPV